MTTRFPSTRVHIRFRCFFFFKLKTEDVSQNKFSASSYTLPWFLFEHRN